MGSELSIFTQQIDNASVEILAEIIYSKTVIDDIESN